MAIAIAIKIAIAIWIEITIWIAIAIAFSICGLIVRGLFLAIVPDSSLARVRRVLVPHMEDEDDQGNDEKEDEREDGKQRVERRRESSNTQRERMDGMK